MAVYFPGLGFLRFFSAAMIFFTHVELMRSRFGLEHVYDHSLVSETGRYAVTSFFTLSGFLITYLLLRERVAAGAISVGKFYVRRMLRIWPLYFLVIALAFFVLPQFDPFDDLFPGTEPASAHFPVNLLLFVFFLPQLALSLWPPVPFAEPLWSIGVEEQFYLFWPWLVKFFRRALPWIMAFILLALPLFRFYLEMKCRTTPDPEENLYWQKFFSFVYYTRFECMAAGGLTAWLLFEKKGLRILFHPFTQIAVMLGMLGLIVFAEAPVYQHLPFAACFAIFLLNVAANPQRLLKLNFAFGDQLGNCSYAFYMFHEIVIALAIWGFGKTGMDPNAIPAKILITVSAFAGTLLLAWLSYRYYERFFLRMKEKWQVVKSSASAP